MARDVLGPTNDVLGTTSTPTLSVAPVGTPANFNTDGIDDHLEIEAAMNALPASGGLIHVSGTFIFGRALRITKAGTNVVGEGVSTIFKLANSADDNVITITGNDVSVDFLKIDGNRTNIDADHHGISVSAARCKLSRLFITDTVHHGIQSANSTDLEIDHVYSQNTGKVGSNRDGVGIVIGAGQGPCIGAKVSNCQVFNTGYHGFQVYRGTQHVEIINCSAAQVGQTRNTGNSLEIHPNTYDVRVSNFIALGANSGAQGAGIVVDSESGSPPAQAVVLHSCMIDGHAFNGITVNGALDTTISACHIKNNGRLGSSANTFGIRLKNGTAGDVTQRIHVTSCHIFDDQTVKTQTYPIGVYDGSTNVHIIGNTFFTNATANTVFIDATSTGAINKLYNTGDFAAVTFDSATTTLKSRTFRRVHTDVVSLYADWGNLASNVAATAINDLYGYVMRVPKTGTLHDIMLSVNSASGNIAVSVYDVGLGSTTRNRLYASGSITCPAQGWNIIADPALAVTEGQLICLAFAVDNTTATFGRYGSYLGSASAELPAAYAPEGNVRMACRKTTAFPDSGTTWTTPGLTTVPFGIVARVS